MSGEPNRVIWRGVQPVDGIRGIWPERNSVRINKYHAQDGVGTQLVYTVPADKRLFISGQFLSSALATNNSTTGQLQVMNSEDAFQFYLERHRIKIAGQANTTGYFCPALEAEETWYIELSSGHADLTVSGGFFGWLEDM